MRIESGFSSWQSEQTPDLGWSKPEPKPVKFDSAFERPPTVVLGLTGFSARTGNCENQVELRAADVTQEGFSLVVTCDDSVKEVTAFWLAYGA